MSNMVDGVDHFVIPTSIHERIERAVGIVTELDELDHAVSSQGGREVLRIVCANHCDDKQW